MITSGGSRTSQPHVANTLRALLSAALMLLCGTVSAQPAQTGAGAYAFTGVNVLPMDSERVLRDHTVVIRDDRIVTVGPADSVDVPANATVIEAAGRYLMPGLAEMHGHIPGPADPQYVEDVLFMYISNGVTLVRNMAGNPSHLALRDRVARGELTGPVIFAATSWVTPNAIPNPDAAADAVGRFQEAGYDLIKLGSLPLDTYVAMAEAANAIDLPFGGHIPDAVNLQTALASRQTSIDHFDRYVEFLAAEHPEFAERQFGFFGSGVVDLADEDRIAEAVRLTIEAGIWNVPTLSLVEHLASDESAESMAQWPEMRYMPPNVVEGWVSSKRAYQARPDFQPAAANRLVELRQQLLRELTSAGALVALGSDAPQFFNVPGFSIHHELRMMQAAGLTPYEVLVTGTRTPAEYFDTPDDFGIVAPGHRADLILLNANPLEDVAHVEQRAGVMVRGEWWPESRIQARLAEIAERH
jgi:imidazolonepropionase-like amidohydrolase